MQFRRHSRFLCLAATLVVALFLLGGCGGGGDTPAGTGTPTTLIVTPNVLSLNAGQVVQLTSQLDDGAGNPLTNTVFTYTATGGVQVSNAGLVCAGTWDSLTAPVVCTPGPATGTGAVTVASAGITTTVNAAIHVRIARMTISTTAPGGGCNSQGETQQFTAQAFDSSNPPVNITSTVGAITYTSSNTASVTIDANGLATAVQPGGAFITASSNGVVSVPATFSSCQPLSIVLTPNTPISLAAAGTSQLTATVTDIKGNPINTANLALTYLTSSPGVATVGATGLITAVGAGSTGVVASCSPPICNGGANANIPVYSNLVPVTVSGSSSTTVYVTGANSTSIVPIPTSGTSSNTAGTAITIPQLNSVQPVINSFLMSRDGSKAFLGSDKELLVLTTATNTIAASSNAIPGKVLAVSPDGSELIYADQSASPKTYVYDVGSDRFIQLTLTGVTTAAAFSADNLKAYLVSGGQIWAASAALSPPFIRQVTSTTTATDVTFLSQGSLGYVAGTTPSEVTAYATCDNSVVGSLNFTATPLKITSSFDSTRVYAVDNTQVDDITISSIGVATTGTPPNCPATVTQSSNTVALPGSITPNQLILTTDDKNLYITTPTNQLVHYDTTAHTTNTITLASGTAITTGGAMLDGQNLYLGATGSNDVHRISVATGADAQQISVGLKDASNNAVSPDFVVVQPK
jgi:hypothetical protein